MKGYLTKAIAVGIPSTLGSSLLAILLIPPILRNVGIENYGTWSLVFIFTGISSTLDIGLPRSLVFLIPKATGEAEANELFTACAALIGGLILLTILVGLTIIQMGIPVWGASNQIPRPIGELLIYTGITVVSSCLVSSLAYSVLEATSRIYVVNICNFTQTVLTYSLAMAASIYFRNARGLIIASDISYILMALVNLVLMWTLTGIRFGKLLRRSISSVLSCGFDFFILGVINTLAMPLMRYLIVRFSPSMAMVGIYDIALKVSQTGNAVLTSFSVPLFSLFSSYGLRQIDVIRKTARRMAWVITALLAAGILFTFAVGAPLFTWLLKVDGRAVRSTAIILLVGWGATSIFQPYIRALWALGKTRQCSIVNLGMLLVNALLIWVFAGVHNPLYRVSMAITGSLIFDGLAHFYLFRYLFRNSGVGPGDAASAGGTVV